MIYTSLSTISISVLMGLSPTFDLIQTGLSLIQDLNHARLSLTSDCIRHIVMHAAYSFKTLIARTHGVVQAPLHAPQGCAGRVLHLL